MKFDNIDSDRYKIIYDDGAQAWFYQDLYHRLNGPAVIEMIMINQKLQVNCKWYYYGTEINCSSQEEFEKILKLKIFW